MSRLALIFVLTLELTGARRIAFNLRFNEAP
jgi:hypothetical protein